MCSRRVRPPASVTAGRSPRQERSALAMGESLTVRLTGYDLRFETWEALMALMLESLNPRPVTPETG